MARTRVSGDDRGGAYALMVALLAPTLIWALLMSSATPRALSGRSAISDASRDLAAAFGAARLAAPSGPLSGLPPNCGADRSCEELHWAIETELRLRGVAPSSVQVCYSEAASVVNPALPATTGAVVAVSMSGIWQNTYSWPRRLGTERLVLSRPLGPETRTDLSNDAVTDPQHDDFEAFWAQSVWRCSPWR